jgi:N-acetylglucosaminyl-diphospho-decaprenol L-rhamnosyltransferase
VATDATVRSAEIWEDPRVQRLPEPEIAIVVVSWNTRELLDRCLLSMRSDVDAGLAEVWVVDNGSSDGSQELVRDAHPWAGLVLPDENLGYGPAVNLAAARSRARWIAPSNSDVELFPGALRALLDGAAGDPGAGAVGPRLILPDGRTQPSVQPFPGPAGALAGILGTLRPGCSRVWDPERPARVPWVTGAFLIVRREAWDEIGGFDAAQWMYAEDLDLCWRLKRAGWATRYEPSARVRHALSAAASKAFGSGMELRIHAATYAWMARRRGLLATWTTAGLEAGAAALLWAVASLLGRGGSLRWRERARRAHVRLRVARLGLRSRVAMTAVR